MSFQSQIAQLEELCDSKIKDESMKQSIIESINKLKRIMDIKVE